MKFIVDLDTTHPTYFGRAKSLIAEALSVYGLTEANITELPEPEPAIGLIGEYVQSSDEEKRAGPKIWQVFTATRDLPSNFYDIGAARDFAMRSGTAEIKPLYPNEALRLAYYSGVASGQPFPPDAPLTDEEYETIIALRKGDAKVYSMKGQRIGIHSFPADAAQDIFDSGFDAGVKAVKSGARAFTDEERKTLDALRDGSMRAFTKDQTDRMISEAYKRASDAAEPTNPSDAFAYLMSTGIVPAYVTETTVIGEATHTIDIGFRDEAPKRSGFLAETTERLHKIYDGVPFLDVGDPKGDFTSVVIDNAKSVEFIISETGNEAFLHVDGRRIVMVRSFDRATADFHSTVAWRNKDVGLKRG